jgi:putative DNA primase/helicase
MNTFALALGDYADNVPVSMFEVGLHGSGIPNDVAKVDGKRFVTSSETGEAARLNEARVKALTGRDPITARFLHKEFFTFQPVAKFWLATNHKPIIRDDSPGFWRRIQLLPFTQSFIGREDFTLKDRLKQELSGILARAVRGCIEWQRMGLKPPMKVLAATVEWRDESNLLAPFIEEECIQISGVGTRIGELYRAYLTWCARRGEEKSRMSHVAFGRKIREKFPVAGSQSKGFTIKGIALRTSSHADESEM